MPNWVYNNLIITDPSEEHATDIDSLMEQVGATYTIKASSWEGAEVRIEEVEVENPGFSFWNIVRPEGEDREKYDDSIGGPGALPFWYDWNCENWGTKWDASNVDIYEHGKSHKQFTFSTPWAPPLPVLVALSEQYPNLHIELDWEEEQGFGGTYVFTKGVGVETDSYDVPSTHAEHEERGKTCICEWDYDDPTEFYPDCPGYISEEHMIQEDELEVEAMT